MWKHKLCLNASTAVPMEQTAQVRLFHKLGFDGFFVTWNEEMNLQEFRALAEELDMIFQSVHAPFGKINHLWEPTELTEFALNQQLACIRASAEAGVDLVVCHAFIGFTKHEPTQFGIENFRVMVEEAKRLGVRIAFENTEGEEYLFALMEAFADQPHVGFCWDTGHEMCYNHSQDLLKKFGSRLLCTHLNDNLGIRDGNGTITFHDDLHLLPFDGIGNWQDIAHRLNRDGYDKELTFELKYPTTLNGCDHKIYGHMSMEEYFTHAYIRACRVAALLDR